MPTPIKRKTVTTAFSIMPRHMEIIEHFIKEKQTFTSGSDVVRQALEFFHDKSFPAYIFHLTPAATEKKEKIDKKKEVEEMDDLQFATDYLKAYIYEGPDGKKYAIFHRLLDNNVFFQPVEGIKKWASDPHLKYDLGLSIEKSTAVPMTTELIIKNKFYYSFEGTGVMEKFMKENNLE